MGLPCESPKGGQPWRFLRTAWPLIFVIACRACPIGWGKGRRWYWGHFLPILWLLFEYGTGLF